MASLENNLDFKMDYQDINLEENIPVSHNDCEKSNQFVSSAACASTKDQDIDLKTCEFDVLLNYLSNKMIFKNIRAIYDFLKGNNDEIEFRGANMYLEEMLVRIVRNVEVLRSYRFNQTCALYCKQIIDLLKKALTNRIFMVACRYKNEKDHLSDRVISYKILIYKKLYFTSHYETPMQILHGPTSIMSMSGSPPMSRSTSMDSLDSQRSNFDIKPSNSFTSHCLQLILNFVKDHTQLNLIFSGLSNSDITYLHSVFSSAIDEKFDNGTLCKNVYRAIWEAVKIFSLKFDFRIRNLRGSLNTKSLLLEKRIKMPTCTDEAGGTTYGRISKKKLKKSEKNQAFVNQLPLDFINSCLKKMFNFLLDESEASLIISVSNPNQRKFVKNIINYIRSPAIKSVFNHESRRIMEQLHELMENRSNYRVKISCKNKFGQKDVKFMKIPNFENRLPQQRKRLGAAKFMTISPSEDSPSQDINMPCAVELMNMLLPADLPPRQSTFCDVETENIPLPEGLPPQQSTSCDVESLNIPPTEDSPPQQTTSCDVESLDIPPPEKSPPQERSRPWPPKLNTSFQPAEIIDQTNDSEADPVLTEMMIKYGHPSASDNKEQWVDSIGYQPKPKPAMPRGKDCRNKLLDALSVPVQSDKALRMMFSMGWTGGALGARGNGITEPIMPYLNRGSGAGLGHKTHTKNNNKLPKVITPVATPSVNSRVNAAESSGKRTAYRFREMFLTHLLDLLASSDNSTTLYLQPKILKKELAFIVHTIKNLAARTKVQLNDDGQNLIDNIEIHYKKDPEMLVTACVNEDRMQIVLTKIHGLGKVVHSEDARNRRLAMTENITKNMSEFMSHYGPMAYTQKSYEELKFKVLYLLEVLKLVKDKTLDHHVVDVVMTLREKNLLRNGLISINQNKKCREKTPDTVLISMIRKLMGCYTVNVKFTKEYTQYTLYKEYLVPSMVAGAHEYAEILGQINNNDTESDQDLAENDDGTNESENVKNENDNMEPDENKTESDDINIESAQAAEGDENDEIVKTVTIDENINEDNENKLTTSCNNNEYSTDEMSISEQSGLNTNVDYNETSDSDISDDKNSDDKPKDSDDHMKIECDKLDLSEISETTLNVGLKEQSQSEDKSDVKIVCLRKNCVFSENTPKFIQGVISHNIIKTKELPLLVCHGVHNDALVYSCHTEKSYDWLLNTCVANQLIIFTKEVDKMSMKINSFCDIYEKDLFNLLELYSKGLSTKEWSVLKKENMSDFVIFDVKIDKKSVNFILESNLSLYAGVDKVIFSII